MSEPSSKDSQAESSPQPENDWRARDRRQYRWLALIAGLLLFIYLIPDIFFRVFPGQAAVVWHLFFGGTDVEYVRSEGLRVKWPWDRAYIYDIRLQKTTETFKALSNDGLAIEVEVSVRFRPQREVLGELHQHVGPDYVKTLIVPELGAHVRNEIASYRPDQLYGDSRQEIQDKILKELTEGLRLDFHPDMPHMRFVIHVEDVLIRNIVLPAPVAASIDAKLAQEQHMLEYDYRLLKEDKERQRKEIEARGIQAFQDIVSRGISEPYLKWKGIDATLELARSNNAKIVVIGASEDGLPIILGGLDGPLSQDATAPTVGTPSTGTSSAAGTTAAGTPVGAQAAGTPVGAPAARPAPNDRPPASPTPTTPPPSR